MKITIVSDVFPPEPVTSAFSARDLAEELTGRGHDVTVIAPFPNRPTGILHEGVRRRFRSTAERDGYSVVHTWHTLSKKSLLPSRLAENISFGITSTIELIRASKPDVVYMNTWPLVAQLLNTATLKAKGVPVICVVHDMYPETILSESPTGVKGLVSRVLRRIDAQVYRWSTKVTALNPRQGRYLETSRGVPEEKIAVIQDWVDGSRFDPPAPQPTEGPFRVRYVGSLTRMAGLDLYIEAAEQLAHRDDIVIELVGDGAMRPDVEAAVAEKGLTNLRTIHPLSPEDVPDVQAEADVLSLSLLAGAAENTTPSKLLYYLFSARPIIASVDDGSPAAQLVRDAGCGTVVAPGDGVAFARAIEDLADKRETLGEMGARAGDYARATFSKDVALPALGDFVEAQARR